MKTIQFWGHDFYQFFAPDLDEYLDRTDRISIVLLSEQVQIFSTPDAHVDHIEARIIPEPGSGYSDFKSLLFNRSRSTTCVLSFGIGHQMPSLAYFRSIF